MLSRFFKKATPNTFGSPDTRLTKTHWFWLTLLIMVTQAQVAPFVPIAVLGFGLSITILRAISLYFILKRPAADDPYSVSGHTAEKIKNRQAKKYGTKKHPFRWSAGLSFVLGIAAIVVVRLSYGILFFRDPSVGFLFILIGIKYAESTTRRDAMLLVCLSSFALVTAFYYTQTPLILISSLVAFFVIGGLLRALSRPYDTFNATAVKHTMKRFSLWVLQGLPIAVLLFFLFPRLAAPLWGIPYGNMAKTGLSDTMAPGEVSELMASDTVAFRVEFEGAVPQNRHLYWRGPVFSAFDGLVWRPAMSPIIRAEPLFNRVHDRGTPIRYSVMLEPSFRHWLFAIDSVASLPQLESGAMEGGARFAFLRASRQLFSYAPIATQIRYTQTSVLTDRFPVLLDNEARDNLFLPRDAAPKTVELAQSLRAGVASPDAFVNAVLRYIRTEPFYYTLTPDYDYVNPEKPLDEFMFNARRGFCEHYAGAFVFMMRAAGVPARVVTGYQGGEMNREGGNYMIVRQSDAHAWAEVLIDNEWRRVDPTAAIAPNRVEYHRRGSLSQSEETSAAAAQDDSWFSRMALRWDAFKYLWTRQVVEFNYNKQRALWQDWNVTDDLWRIVSIILIGAMVWLAALAVLVFKRGSRRDPIQHAWETLTTRLAQSGLPREPHEGAKTYLSRARSRWTEYAILFSRFERAYTLLRYGNLGGKDRARLSQELKTLMRRLPTARQLRKVL
ncbi:MAG: DUF3488 and transglutaminase-like domain-containing protein [Burkholderiales bacterium]|nr:DUF3488 and transglutaminase-like domain-containing protein [Burkholderiales bacterium]